MYAAHCLCFLVSLVFWNQQIFTYPFRYLYLHNGNDILSPVPQPWWIRVNYLLGQQDIVMHSHIYIYIYIHSVHNPSSMSSISLYSPSSGDVLVSLLNLLCLLWSMFWIRLCFFCECGAALVLQQYAFFTLSVIFCCRLSPTNNQLILTGEHAYVDDFCWQFYKLNLHVISNHTQYLQTLGFHGQIRVTSSDKNDKIGWNNHIVGWPVLDGTHRKWDCTFQNAHTKLRNETSTSPGEGNSNSQNS